MKHNGKWINVESQEDLLGKRNTIELNRLPTAQILKEEGGKYQLSTETFRSRIEMRLRSQKDSVTISNC